VEHNKTHALKDYRPIVCRASGIYLGEQKKSNTHIQRLKEKKRRKRRGLGVYPVAWCAARGACKRVRALAPSAHILGKLNSFVRGRGMIQLTPSLFNFRRRKRVYVA